MTQKKCGDCNACCVVLSIDTPEFALKESADTLHISMVLTAMWLYQKLNATP